MEILERIWEIFSGIGGAIARAIERSITAVLGSSNARFLKKLQPKVDAINSLEAKYQRMSDEELRAQTSEFRQRLTSGETEDDLLVEAFAVCREGGRRFLNMRHYDVQLIGGMVLHSGSIAEMVTGEGKTLVATLPAYLNALSGQGVHVITVNDYLARRDMEWMAPLYMGLGLTVDAIQGGMDSAQRQKAYACDITYGTNNEFGFDYLRDNMRPAARGDDRYPSHLQQAQGRLHFAIVDEIDNILIDEARTPLIISGPAYDDVTKYPKADRIARQLTKDVHFEVKEKEHSVNLTEEGVREAEKQAGVDSFYTAGNMEWPHLIDNALKAHHLYKRDVNYMIQDDEIIIVDEFTGRAMPGRNWSDGLHQSVEAKEGVRVKEENQTLATITLQNFFKLYNKICGMTGTAMTEAGEFWKIYQLDVIAIPTNKDLERLNFPDVIYRTEKEKYDAIIDEIERLNKWDILELAGDEEVIGTLQDENDDHYVIVPKDSTSKHKNRRVIAREDVRRLYRRGRPILVGTTSIERSEHIGQMLERRGIGYELLNAKQHRREAEIIAQAGRPGAVTIATNMAGRGTDIVLGGNPEAKAWGMLQDKYETRLDVPQEEWTALVQQIEQQDGTTESGRRVAEMGGLHVIGTERHEARRIDLQLRGRCGRQGDPGSSRFYLSLEDDLMRIFAGEWVKNILTRLGMQEGEAIESGMVSRRIEAAQRKVEERNFEVRKNLLEYDEVMDEQRKRVYGYRQQILDGSSCRKLIFEMIDGEIDSNLDTILDPEYGAETFARWADNRFGLELDARDLRSMDFDSAESYVKDQAQRRAETLIVDTLDENLPDVEDTDEWNWDALARFANTRWNLNLRDRDLKKVGRDGVSELLLEKANQSIEETDCSEVAHTLEPDFRIRSARGWVAHKFGIQLDEAEVGDLDPTAFKNLVREKARQAYEDKETEFPVLAGMYRYTKGDTQGQKRFDREKLAAWASERFGITLDVEDLKNKQREEIRAFLIDHSRATRQHAEKAMAEVSQKVSTLFGDQPSEDLTAGAASGHNGALVGLSQWIEESLNQKLTVDELGELDRHTLEQRLRNAVDDRYGPEMRRMERALLLQLLDAAWKDHLLAMDHLRSSVGLRGYAQIDPKVEYKREGMRTFEQMWGSIGTRVTDLVFRMEQLDEGFVNSTWVESQARHDEAASATEIARQQQQAIEGTESKKKIEPIRNRQSHVGRNDPCPCGSGKKFKNCCMRKSQAG
jgi:preprotein translocase subunit SecA